MKALKSYNRNSQSNYQHYSETLDLRTSILNSKRKKSTWAQLSPELLGCWFVLKDYLCTSLCTWQLRSVGNTFSLGLDIRTDCLLKRVEVMAGKHADGEIHIALRTN